MKLSQLALSYGFAGRLMLGIFDSDSWGEISDKSAIPPLKDALGDNSLTMPASAFRALEKLQRGSPDYSRYRTSDGNFGFAVSDAQFEEIWTANSKFDFQLNFPHW
jgi:hypothetical protein